MMVETSLPVSIKNFVSIYYDNIETFSNQKLPIIYFCQQCGDCIYKKKLLQCKNGHMYCENCWKESLEKIKKCMDCCVDCSFENLSRCRYVEDQLAEMKLDCPLSFSNILENGPDKKDFQPIKDYDSCCETISVGKLEDHVKSCTSRFVKCNNNDRGCPEVMRLNHLSSHMANCVYEETNCPYCDCTLIKKLLNEHIEKCDEVYVQCSQCSYDIKRGLLRSHVGNDCLATIIPCKFKSHNCNVRVKRCEMADHLNENHNTQIFNFLETNTEQLNILNDKFSSKFDNLSKELISLSIQNEKKTILIEKLIVEIDSLKKKLNEKN